MKIGIMILVTVFLAFFVLFIFNKFVSSAFITNENIDDSDIPVTWNLDWQGGPGYDRYKILTEEAPYNPGGWTAIETQSLMQQ